MTNAMVQARMQEEIDELRAALSPLSTVEATEIVKACAIAASPKIKDAWADHCGIDVSDERVQEADKVGWPSDYGLFERGWNAAVRAMIAAAPSPSSSIEATEPILNTIAQAFAEMHHAHSDPNWFTKGHAGANAQFRLWLDRGVEALKTLRSLQSAIQRTEESK